MDKLISHLTLLLLTCDLALCVRNGTAVGYSNDFVQDPCGERVIYPGENGLSLYGFIRARREGPYLSNKTCSIRIQAPENHGIIIRIQRVEIYRPFSDCNAQDALHIEGQTSNKTFCGFGYPSYAILSTANFLTIRLVTGLHDFDHSYTGFQLYYTVFHQDTCETGEHGNEFRCRSDNRCIPRELKCDRLDNCGDWSDESVSTCGLSTAAIITTSVICALVGGTCIGFGIFYCYTKVKQRRERTRRANEISPTMTAEYSAAHGGQTTIRIENSNAVVNVNGVHSTSVTSSSRYAEPPPPYTYTSVGLYATQDVERDPGAPPAYENPALVSDDTQSAPTQEMAASAAAAAPTSETTDGTETDKAETDDKL